LPPRHGPALYSVDLSGIDYFRGDFSFTSRISFPLIEGAQKQNINIWSIYAPDDGHRSRDSSASPSASELSQLSERPAEKPNISLWAARHVEALF